MSLLALMNRNKEIFKAVAPSSSMFYCPDGNKPFSKEGLRVESKLTPQEAGLVGTAFDYLLRAQVAKWSRDPWEDTVEWWATFGVERLIESVDLNSLNSMLPYNPKEKNRWVRFYAQKYADCLRSGKSFDREFGEIVGEAHRIVLQEQNKEEHDEEFSQFWESEMEDMMFRDMMFDQLGDMPAKDIFLEAFDIQKYRWLKLIFERYLAVRERWIDFVKGNKVEKDLLISDVCFLARFEQLVRSGIRIDPEDVSERMRFIAEPSDIIVEDMRNLWAVLEEQREFFSNSKRRIYNPAFGAATKLIGGADADIIIDETLIDIKTTKSHGYAWIDAAQVTSYYVMALMAGEPLPLHRVGFYKSRYGRFEFVDTERLYKELDLKGLARWLIDHNRSDRLKALLRTDF